LKTKYSDISGWVSPDERRLDQAATRKRNLDILVLLQDLFGGDDNAGTPMDST
jgi:hypothetical protein